MAEERGGKKAGRGGRKSEGIRWRMVHDMSDGKKRSFYRHVDLPELWSMLRWGGCEKIALTPGIMESNWAKRHFPI